MELAAEYHIRIARPDRRQEVAQLPSRNVAVAVDEAEVAASPLSQADAQRGSLALVFRQLDYPDLVDPGDRRWTSVGRAVRYRDHLEGDPLGPEGVDDGLHVESQAVSRVVERNDQAEVDLGRRELEASRRSARLRRRPAARPLPRPGGTWPPAPARSPPACSRQWFPSRRAARPPAPIRVRRPAQLYRAATERRATWK